MPSTINIWEEANMAECAQTGGSWSYTGSITPAPTAPLTYNGTADFTGITTVGDYEFTYTVGSHSATYTVSYGISTARVNDTCATSRFISNVSTGYALISDYNSAKCPGYAAPTDSGATLPASWQYGTYTGDLWYHFDMPAIECPYQTVFTIDGSGYNNGVTAPAVAIYEDLVKGDCADRTFVIAGAESSQQFISVSTMFSAFTKRRIWVRVASIGAGDFDLITEIIYPTDCNEVPTTTPGETWGYETDNVWGDETGDVWGY